MHIYKIKMPDTPFAGPSLLFIKHVECERIAHIPERLDSDTLLARGALELIFVREYAIFWNPVAEPNFWDPRTAFIGNRNKFLQWRCDFETQTL